MLTLEERIERIEKWIDFWETIETGWSEKLPNKHRSPTQSDEPINWPAPDVVIKVGTLVGSTQNPNAELAEGRTQRKLEQSKLRTKTTENK